MKKLLIFLVALFVFTPMAVTMADDPQPSTKEEVVYAQLEATGAIGDVYVVNAFPSHSGQVVDYGDYSQIANLSDTASIEHTADRITVTTDTTPFYYQGLLTQARLPWIVSITYTLDGQEVTPSELQGRSGDLEIRIQVAKNPAADPVFFDNYMVQISMSFDSARFTGISTESGVIATAGDHKQVSFTAMKGQTGDFSLSAHVSDAQLGTIQIAGLPFDLGIEMPDIDAYVSQLTDLKNAIAQLADGLSTYDSSVTQLSDGTGQLSSGANELSTNAARIASGFASLHQAQYDYLAGVIAYEDGVKAVNVGVGQLGENMDQLVSALSQLTQGSSELASSMDLYADAMPSLAQGIAQSSQAADQIHDGLTGVGDALRLLTEQGKDGDTNLVQSSAGILQGLTTIKSALDADSADTQALVQALSGFSNAGDRLVAALDSSQLNDAHTGLSEALTTLDTVRAAIDQVHQHLADPDQVAADLGVDSDDPQVAAVLDYMAAQGEQLATALTQLDAAYDTISQVDSSLAEASESLTQFASQWAVLKPMIDQISQGVTSQRMAQVKAGIDDLVTSYSAFHTGLGAYVDGVEGLYQGVSGDSGLISGSDSLAEGLSEASNHAETLSQSASQLAAGTHSLDDGIAQLGQSLGAASQLDEITDELLAGATSLCEGQESIVQGYDQLDDAVDAYADGVGSYATGVSSYADGVARLSSAGDQLTSGAGQLKQETSTMDTRMRDQIEQSLDPYTPSDFEMHSFTSLKNTAITTVQFVYTYPGQGAVAEESQEAESDDEQSRSLWDRIVDLFR